MDDSMNRPGFLQSVLTNKCPHCRKGSLFITPNPYDLKNTMKMPDECPVCGQKFELHTGFYFGTGYVSYAVTALFIGLVFVLWGVLFGLSVRDSSVFWCLGVSAALVILLQPVLQRLSRSIWIAMFVKYDPKWKNQLA